MCMYVGLLGSEDGSFGVIEVGVSINIFDVLFVEIALERLVDSQLVRNEIHTTFT